jgi:hypothetical protein
VTAPTDCRRQLVVRAVPYLRRMYHAAEWEEKWGEGGAALAAGIWRSCACQPRT